MKTSTRMIAVDTLALALALVTTQAFAAPAAPTTAERTLGGRTTIYRGFVSAVDTTTLTLETADGPAVTLALTPETRIRVPGPKAASAVLLIGMRVVVQAVTDENDTLTARSVTVIPDKPEQAHRVGTVTEYSAGVSMTILATDGNSYTFALTGDSRILPPGLAQALAVDSRVTVIAPRDTAASGATATGIVVHPPRP